jgi:RNA polymerase sigma factor (sigma-70 family)
MGSTGYLHPVRNALGNRPDERYSSVETLRVGAKQTGKVEMNQASVATLDTAAGRPPIPAAARNEQALVAAARHGDDRAFEELYARYRARILAFALRMSHDPDRAEDLVQDVFMSALRRLRETDAPIAFRPWIYEIARNACIDEHRRRRRVSEVPIERDGLDGWLDHLAGGPSPERAMEAKQELEDLRVAFRGLSERHHRIIVARELEGKSYRQIGEELGMSQVVVESTLFRARRRLSEEFQELATGRRCERVHSIIATAHGRRLGVRERRAVTTHIEHCRPCRREALAAGFSPRPPRALRRVAAGLVPVPLLRLLRRGGDAARQRALNSVFSADTLGQTLSCAGVGRIAAAAAVAVAAGVGGGLLSQATPAPAQTAPAPPAPAQLASRPRAIPAREIFRPPVTAYVTAIRRPAAASRPGAGPRAAGTGSSVRQASSTSRPSSPRAGLVSPATEVVSIQVPTSSPSEVRRPSLNEVGATAQSVPDALKAPVGAAPRGSLGGAAPDPTRSGDHLVGSAAAVLGHAGPKLVPHSPPGL